ncbi:hypothetical protein [Actinoplanes sp. NBRC 101535]|uniref:hypothetical protein n=1 Tax=Actinoplanes sp. NBRC 101535 TaxID=3032196 RepID=UPI0024A05A76|nr:hypothetical protein [Actinoplanes sp. NBRC 101535]GLY02356.1 hypothetical protein Acsp01_27350 [Actinoplanes sp. NBRC 101535]
MNGRGPAAQDSHEPRAYERAGAWTVDRAVRALATGCRQQGRPAPGIGTVELGPATITLRLTGPDLAPPPGWFAEPPGRIWSTELNRLDRAPVDDRLPHPCPALVSLGTVGDARLLLNLAAAPGVIGLEGDLGLAGSLIRSWARRLTAAPWSGGLRVVRVGFEPDPGFTGLDVGRLAEAGPLLTGMDAGVLLFAVPPQRRDRYQVDLLLAERVRRWSVVTAGPADPVWRFVVGMDGSVDTGLLAQPVRLRAA